MYNTVENSAGTICLTPDSILSRYLDNDLICIGILKYCDSILRLFVYLQSLLVDTVNQLIPEFSFWQGFTIYSSFCVVIFFVALLCIFQLFDCGASF